jgi:hypothetical protein
VAELRGKEAFFFEKKNQKTFAIFRCAVGRGARLKDKSFLVLFFKKELLSFSA